ncbi:type II secretion system protein [Clostridium niameyense]|uniref:Type II secretion system protein n=1 Tax=Clostridium niameyense TaxID=1622073 RepID=A0A6M0RAS8_9CLOT|nr:type II secretion system protein [Clostridium niameyense]NEZ46328.1 type II secretion system protein [Clostridium niameyense]
MYAKTLKGRSKKGFTILEVILYISIYTILLSFVVINIEGNKKITNDIKTKEFSTSILNLINSSRNFCKGNNMGGYIYFNIEDRNINFYMTSEKVYGIRVPKGFNIMETNSSKLNSIYIDNNGMIADACTIKFKDKMNKIHKITICVGSSYVQIKE